MPTEHAKRHRGCGRIPTGQGLWEPEPTNPNRRRCATCDTLCTCSSCKAARPPLLDVPNRCVVLGVDVAANSGWALWGPRVLRGEVAPHEAVLASSGEVKARKLDQLAGPIMRGLNLADAFDLPLVLALEVSAQRDNPITTLGIGKAVGQWELAWLHFGGVAARILHLQPQEWRKDLWGASPPRDEARTREQTEACHVKCGAAHIGSPPSTGVGGCTMVGPDEAPAILIGKWGMHSPQVNALLPRKFRQVDGGEGRAA